MIGDWNHTYVEGDPFLSYPVWALFVRALNERLIACGFPPATRGHPRPFGMPPFATVLSDADVAAVISYIRGAWGNRAAPVSELAVAQQRSSRRE